MRYSRKLNEKNISKCVVALKSFINFVAISVHHQSNWYDFGFFDDLKNSKTQI